MRALVGCQKPFLYEGTLLCEHGSFVPHNHKHDPGCGTELARGNVPVPFAEGSGGFRLELGVYASLMLKTLDPDPESLSRLPCKEVPAPQTLLP